VDRSLHPAAWRSNALADIESVWSRTAELLRTPSTRSSGRSLYITATSPLHHPYEGVREARPLYSSKIISSKRNITKTTPILPLTRYLLLRGRAKARPGPIGPGPPAKGTLCSMGIMASCARTRKTAALRRGWWVIADSSGTVITCSRGIGPAESEGRALGKVRQQRGQ
jgi:hypothetical protein